VKLEIKDVARMLDLPEATIGRWIRQGKIPARLERGRYIFEEGELRTWAQIHNITLRSNRLAKGINDEANITLCDAMESGGVFYDVDGDNPEQVFRAAIDLINLPSDVDKDLLLEKLLQREELSSTGIGQGVAIPHPRHPLENFSLRAMVPTCFLKKEVDFDAIDGKPVFVIFIMLCATTKIHLRLLSRLSFCLRNEEFVRLLGYHPPQETLLEKVRELEGQL